MTSWSSPKVTLLAFSMLPFVIVPAAFSQPPKPIFDGRLTLKPTPASPAEEKLWKSWVVPAARKSWHDQKRDALCESGFQPALLDVAPGSFTKPQASQKAILYKYCTLGHNMALDGVAIIENDRVVAHVIFEGGENRAIGGLPDINANGLSEIVIVAGGTNQGITSSWISIIELAGDEVTSLGQTATFSDDCGVNEKDCKTTANRLSVKIGNPPAFFREVFLDSGTGSGLNSWKKSAGPVAISMDEDQIEYAFIP